MSAIIREETVGPCRLILGDCLSIVPAFLDGSVDHVISDPPYGDSDTHASHLSSVTLKDGTPARQALGFDGISRETGVEIAREWVRVAKRWVVFTCEWKHVSAIHDAGHLVRFGIWRKPDGAPQFTGDRPGTGWEAVAICHRTGRKRWNGGGKHAFWTWPKGQNTSGHPTGKPLPLFIDLVRDFTDLGETVLDPFMGRGTTAEACIREGRQFIGIEQDVEHYEYTVRRTRRAWQDKQSEIKFDEPPKTVQLSLMCE